MEQQQPGKNFFAENPDLQKYFHSLPVSVQENIMQSGVQITSLKQLQKCAETLLRK